MARQAASRPKSKEIITDSEFEEDNETTSVRSNTMEEDELLSQLDNSEDDHARHVHSKLCLESC